MSRIKLSKCDDCGHVCPTEELTQTKTTYEQYYGVAHEFGNHHTLYLLICPECGCEEVNSYEPEDESEYDEYE